MSSTGNAESGHVTTSEVVIPRSQVEKRAREGPYDAVCICSGVDEVKCGSISDSPGHRIVAAGES